MGALRRPRPSGVVRCREVADVTRVLAWLSMSATSCRGRQILEEQRHILVGSGGWTGGRLPVQPRAVEIQQVALTVSRPEAAAAFYRDVLELPVSSDGGRFTVAIGSSCLVLEQSEQFHGVHHLAVGIAPADFELARSWLSQRVEPISVDGSEVIDGPEGWDSRSLYFLGPEDIVLEYIARQAHAHLPVRDGRVPRPLSVSEVGIGVPDVQEAVGDLHRVLGLPPFPPQGSSFAPVGDHDGLIILVDQERVWFPTDAQQAARGPVRVQLAGARPGQLSLRRSADVFFHEEGAAAGEPAPPI